MDNTRERAEQLRELIAALMISQLQGEHELLLSTVRSIWGPDGERLAVSTSAGTLHLVSRGQGVSVALLERTDEFGDFQGELARITDGGGMEINRSTLRHWCQRMGLKTAAADGWSRPPEITLKHFMTLTTQPQFRASRLEMLEGEMQALDMFNDEDGSPEAAEEWPEPGRLLA